MKEGWKYVDFKDVYPIKMGKTPPRGDKSSWDNEKVTSNKWVSIADISLNEGKTIYDTKEYISDNAALKINKVSKGSLLMSFKLSIGRMAFAGDDLYTNEAIIAIPEHSNYNLRFIYYYLLQYDWKSLTEGNEKVKGATLNKQSIGKIKLPTINISDQHRIVSYLDTSFAQIDALAKQAEESLENAKALFQATLKELMEKKEGWEENKLKDIGRTQTGTTPSKTDKSNYGDYIPFIRPSEIDFDSIGGIDYNSEIKLSQQGLSKGRLFKKKSILMVCIGATISKVGYCIQDVSCNQQINVLTPTDDFNYKFIYYAMLSPKFKNEVIKQGTSSQATLPIINKGKWELLTIAYPSLEEQERIANTLDTISNHISQLQSNYTQTLANCQALKQALLRETFE